MDNESANDGRSPDSTKALADEALARIRQRGATLRLVEKPSAQPSPQPPLSQIETGVVEVDISSKKVQWKMRTLYTFIFLTSLGLMVAFLSWWDTFNVNKRRENTALLASLVKVTDARRAVSLPQTVTQTDTTPTLQEVLQQLPNVFVPPITQPHTTSQTSEQVTEQAGGTPLTIPTSQNVYECPVQICARMSSPHELNPRNTGLRELELVAIGNGTFFVVQNKNNIFTICTNNKEFADIVMREKLTGQPYTTHIDQTCYQWFSDNSNGDLAIHTSSAGEVYLRFIK